MVYLLFILKLLPLRKLIYKNNKGYKDPGYGIATSFSEIYSRLWQWQIIRLFRNSLNYSKENKIGTHLILNNVSSCSKYSPNLSDLPGGLTVSHAPRLHGSGSCPLPLGLGLPEQALSGTSHCCERRKRKVVSHMLVPTAHARISLTVRQPLCPSEGNRDRAV